MSIITTDKLDLSAPDNFQDLQLWLFENLSILRVEDFHEIGQIGEPAFQNSWANVGLPYANASFYCDPFGVVRLKGWIDTGVSGTVAFTLPAAYAPSEQVEFVVANAAGGPGPGSSSVSVAVHTNGDVIPTFSAGSDAALDSINFKVPTR